MKANKTQILSALLVLQLVAAVLLTYDFGSQAQSQQQGPLLALETNQVDKIRIEEQDKPALELHKQNGDWQLPGYHGLAAQAAKVDSLLNKLQELERNWPVASTGTSAKRFEVTEEKYQRKVTLLAGDQELTTLYLGSSPDMRKTHVRLNGEEDIYALPVHLYDAPVQGQDWVDTSLVQVDTAKLAKIEGDDFTLQRTGEFWQLDGLGEQEITDDQAVHNLLSGLRNLRFQEVLGTEAKPEFGLEQPALSLNLSLNGQDAPVSYQFGKAETGDHYVLKSSGQAVYFKIPAAQLDQLINLKRAAFAKGKPEPETPAETEATATEQEQATS